MKIYLQTTISPILAVYDSAAPAAAAESKTDWKGLIKKILRPVVVVTDDRGRILYKTGDFYSQALFYTITAAAALVLFFVLRRLVYR